MSHQRPTRGTFSCLSLLVTSIPREFSSAPRAHKNSTTRNKMAFSMTSALSSRVSATTSSLRTQRVQKRQSASFKCNAYDEAEIDKRYPQGAPVYKVCFSFFSRSLSLFLSLSLFVVSRDIANDDNATFARRCCRCFFARVASRLICLIDRFYPSFRGFSSAIRNLRTNFFFLFFEEDRKRESV